MVKKIISEIVRIAGCMAVCAIIGGIAGVMYGPMYFFASTRAGVVESFGYGGPFGALFGAAGGALAGFIAAIVRGTAGWTSAGAIGASLYFAMNLSPAGIMRHASNRWSLWLEGILPACIGASIGWWFKRSGKAERWGYEKEGQGTSVIGIVLLIGVLLFLLFGRAAALYHAKDEVLLIAAQNGNNLWLKAAIAAGGNVNARNEKGGFGWGPDGDTPEVMIENATALILAAGMSHSASVGILLDAGADLEAVDRKGQTALLIAVKAESPEIVKLLLSAGARTEVKDTDGNTPLSWAKKKRYDEIIRILESAS